MFFSVLLWFVPIIVLNLGYAFLSNLYNEIEEQKQIQQTQIQLQSMSATSDFAFQFSKHAGDFNSDLKHHTETIPIIRKKIGNDRAITQLKNFIETSERSIFKPPFPEYDLLVFYIPSNFANKTASSMDAKEFLIYSTPKITTGLSAIGQSFQYLVNIYEESNNGINNLESEKQSNEILKKKLNNLLKTPLIDVDVIAKTQRGKPTYCLYKNLSHRFMWNYFTGTDKSIYGFFLFCKNTQEYEQNSKIIAINNFKEDDKTGKNKAAFIPIIKGYGGAVYSDKSIENSALFHNWIKNNLPNNNKELEQWNLKDAPNGFKIGNYYTGYSYIGKSQTHLSVVLVPNIVKENRPLWINAITIIYILIMFFILLRGLLFDKWPVMNLKTRFTLSYILACVFPVSLLVITLGSYLIQYEQSKFFQGISNLQNCVNEFDTRKNQLLESYRALFQSVMNDKNLIEALKSNGTLSNKIPSILKKLFEEKTSELPVFSVTLFDEGGDGCSLKFNKEGKVASAATLILSKSHDKKEISDTKTLKTSLDQSITNIITPISKTLREKKQEAGYQLKDSPIKITEQQELLEQGFSSISGESLSDDLESRRGFINILNNEGDEVFMRFHDFIKVDSKPFCSIIVRWNDEALDRNTYTQTEAMLTLKNPEFLYIAFHNTPEGLIKITENRHINKAQYEKMYETAKYTSIRKCESRIRDNKSYYFAAPSKRYKDLIFVGVGKLDDISTSIQIRQIICLVIILITGLVIYICNYVSSRIILEPTNGLKTALNEIINGKLNIEIIGDSHDEFGQLCHEFSMMTQGLRERNRLATLISDQAIEAIGSGEFGDFNTESFKGVVLVSDIRSFTSTCEKYPASLITEMLNEHFAEMTQIISAQGGRIYKYIGDAIEAIFPEDSRYTETAAKRAFNASSRMIIKLYQINKKRKKLKLFTYKIGIGLRYGLLHSGTIGSIDTRMDYAILGEPLQTAAELESLSINNPSFPLVVDEIICNELTANGLNFQALPNVRIPSFILSDLGNNLSQPELAKEQKNVNIIPEKQYSENKEIFKKIYAKSSINNIPYWLSLAVCFSFLIFIGVEFFIGYYISKKTKIEAYERIASSSNLRLAEQFKVNNIQKNAFENGCRKFFVETEKLLNDNATEQEINNCIEKYKIIVGFKRILLLKTQKRENNSFIIDETYKYNF